MPSPVSNHAHVNLEAPDMRAFAVEDPRGFLAGFPRGAILDEVQRASELPSYLQPMIDADPAPGRWVLTGSQNLALLESVSQSLAGRTAVHHLLPLARSELQRFPSCPEGLDEALLAGGFPRIFDRGLAPSDWIRSYVATYIERDVRMISNLGDITLFQRFLQLCAGRTAQMLNLSSLSGDCGISQPTARAWLSILDASFVAFRLPAFSARLRKRLVKTPKLRFYDTGVVCWLLGILTPEQLRSHPLWGAVFETWVVSEVLKHRTNCGETGGLSYYRDRSGAEANLVVQRPERPFLIEARSTATASSNLLTSVGRVRGHLSEQGDYDISAVYGGRHPQSRSDGTLIPWHLLHETGLWR